MEKELNVFKEIAISNVQQIQTEQRIEIINC